MFADIIWFPKQASTTAQHVDRLLLLPGRRSAASSACWWRCCSSTSRSAIAAGPARRHAAADAPAPRRWSCSGRSRRWSIFMVIFVWGAERLFRRLSRPGRRHGDLRRRQAVDVEVPAPRRPARDQRAARAGRPAGQAAADLRGRDPQLLRAGLPRPHGRAARPLHLRLVPGRPGRAPTTCFARSTAAPTTPA